MSSVVAMPASSRMTVAPAGGRRSGRSPSARSLASVIVGQPASRASTSAALPDGARPSTGRPCEASAVTAAESIVVFPAPAGPITSTSGVFPATARAAVAWASSRPAASTCRIGTAAGPTAVRAQATSRRSWTRTASVVSWRSTTCSLTGRPSARSATPGNDDGCSSMHRAAAVPASSSMSLTRPAPVSAASGGTRVAISPRKIRRQPRR